MHQTLAYMKQLLRASVLGSCLTLAALSGAQAQSTPLISKDAAIDRFYTKGELDGLSKADLVTIYKGRVYTVYRILPFVALTSTPGATYEDIGIPATKDNINLLNKELSELEELHTDVDQMIDLLIPYADKSDIIWAILYFDDVIKRAMLGNSM